MIIDANFKKYALFLFIVNSRTSEIKYLLSKVVHRLVKDAGTNYKISKIYTHVKVWDNKHLTQHEIKWQLNLSIYEK